MSKALYTHKKSFPYSSNLEAAYWDRETENLWIEFQSGRIAGYKDVPYTVYMTLSTASSAGGYYNSTIKGFYSGISTLHVDGFEMRVYTDALEVANKRTYRVRGTATVEISVVASTVDEAVEMAKAQSKTLKVEEVTVSFV